MPSIKNFINNFKGGTRKNRFRVNGSWPSNVPYSVTTFHILSATLPPSVLGMVTVPFRGRELNMAGDREYLPWDILILDDTGSNNLWKSFQTWQKLINDHEDNIHNYGADDSFNNAKAFWTVEHLDMNGNVLKTINLNGCWPATITPIEFNMKENTYNTFGVRLNYDFFEYFNSRQLI